MKQIFFHILFCVLFGSTLAHEYLRAHELTPKFRKKLSSFRDNNESCSYVCPLPKPTVGDEESSLRLIINKEVSVVAVLNVTSSVALAVDLQVNVAVLFNGTTGTTIYIDLETETGIYFAAGSSDKLWLASNISFVEYLLALGSLENIKDYQNGTPFQIKTASQQIIIEIGFIISNFGSDLAERVKVNVKAALSIIIVLSKVLVLTLGGSLSILIKKVEGVEFVIKGGLVKLVTLFKGLANLSGKIAGGLEALIIADVEFKLSLILAAASGLEAVVALFKQVANKVDLSKIIGPLLQSPEAFLEIVVSFEQGFYGGVSGVVAVLYNVLLLVSKKISIEVFIDIIIQVSASGSSVTTEQFSTVIGSLIEVIQIQITTYQCSQSWQAILVFFKNIQDGKLVVGGCDISAILTAVIQNAGKASLNFAVGILAKLSAVVGFGVCISTLYLRLMFFIISGQGIVYILKLFPSINLSIDFSSGTSIIAQIIKGVQLTKIIQFIITFNIIGLISNLPVFGDIFNGVVAAIEASGQKVEDFKYSLKGTTVITVLFGWVKYGLGLAGGSAPSGGIAGQIIIGGGASIDISSSTSVSSSSSISVVTSFPIIGGITSSSLWGGLWTINFKKNEGRKHSNHEEKHHKLKKNEIH